MTQEKMLEMLNASLIRTFAAERARRGRCSKGDFIRGLAVGAYVMAMIVLLL